jgi:hypothetical protein
MYVSSLIRGLAINVSKRVWFSYRDPIGSTLERIPGLGFLLVILALTCTLSAQEYRGLIIGRVTDPSGAVVSNATVVARGPQQTYTAKTNNNGDFTIPFVQPGTYDVTAEAQGFKRENKQGVNIDVSQKVNLNFSLQVGTTGEEVRVQADLVGVNTADASGGTVMDPEKVQNLPLNGRQVYMLMTLTPGVRFTTGTFGPTGNSGTRGWDQTNAYQINGVINNLNQFTLNGAPISQQTSTARGGWFLSPNVDGVQEFKVQTNTYDASIGRSGGGTINVIMKSGTNAFHGTAFDFWRNSIFDANFYQLSQIGQPKGFHNQHQFGGTIGGPIKKNKTFFFFSFEGWREVLPIPVITTVPAGIVQNLDGSVDMSAFLAGRNISGIYNPFACATGPAGNCTTRQRLSWNGKNDVIPPNLVSPIGLKILGLYPQANQPGFINNYVSNTRGIYRYSQPIVRIDHNFTDKTKLYGMFSWWSGTEFRNNSGFSDPRIQRGNINNYRAFLSQILDLTHTFSPTFVGDIRFSFSRAKDRAPNGGLAAGLGKLAPQDLGFTNYPIPPTTDKNVAPQIQFASTGTGTLGGVADIIGNSQFSDVGHPPLNETYEVSPTITQTIGKHNVRYGGQFIQIYAIPCCGSGNTTNGPAGRFEFRSTFTQLSPTTAGGSGSSLASLLLGIPGDQTNSGGNIPFNLPIYEGYPYYAVYGQDDWKVRPNLTLNLGLRWDVELSPDERYNRLNGGFCYTCRNPITDQINFPANNGLGTSGLTMPNPIVGGFTFIGNGRTPYDTQWNHFAPKIGVSWGLNNKTVIRGGYGVAWAFAFELGGNTTFTQTTNYQTSAAAGGTTPTTLFNSGNPYPGGLLQPLGPSQGLLSSLGDGQSFDQRNRKITKVQQYSLGLQRELPGQVVLDMSYVGTYSSNIRIGTNFDALSPAQIAQCRANPAPCAANVPNLFFGVLPAASTLGRATQVAAWRLAEPFPQFDTTLFSNTEPVGWSDYNSLQMKINKRFSGGGALVKGLSFLSSFTWSKNMVANSLLNNNNGQCPGCVDIARTSNDPLSPFIPKPLYQIDTNDRTIDFAFSGIYGLPMGKDGLWNPHGVLGALVNNWSLDYIFTAASGTPITLDNTFAFNCPQNNNDYLPTHRTFNEWLYNETPSCFTSLPSNTWQPRTLVPRRSTIRNPYAPQLAMAISKVFQIREGLNLQFKTEAFNLTNTPIFGGPSTGNPNQAVRQADPISCRCSFNGMRILAGQPGAFTGYGTIGSTQQNFPRQLQMSLKVLF